MKMTLWALALVASVGCASSTDIELPIDPVVDTSWEVTLQAGEEKTVANGVLRVGFVGVSEDSRCPVDLTCVWEGNAVVDVTLTLGSGPTIPVQVNTALEPRTAISSGLSVTVVDLVPKQSEASPPSAADYRVTLRIVPA